jgi:hypothetical protein
LDTKVPRPTCAYSSGDARRPKTCVLDLCIRYRSRCGEESVNKIHTEPDSLVVTNHNKLTRFVAEFIVETLHSPANEGKRRRGGIHILV